MRLRPYLNKVKVYVRGRTTLAAAAVNVYALEKSEDAICPPSIFLENEFDKVIAVQGETTFDVERCRITGGPTTHAPLKRYEFKDAFIFDNGLCVSEGTFLRYGRLPHREILTKSVHELDKAVFCAAPPSMRYFGHWLMESCCTALLQRDNEDLILPTPANWPDTKSYVDYFDFKPAQGSVFRVKNASLYEDFAQGQSHRARYGELRRRLRQKFPDENGRGKRFYLKRGPAGAVRHCVNEAAIIERLQKDGFEVLDIEKESIENVLRRGMDADLIVTMEGSNQAHGVLMLRERGLLVAIQPADRFSAVYRGRTAAMNIEYGFVVAEKANNEGGYRLDEDALMRTLDLYTIPAHTAGSGIIAAQ